VTFGSAAAVASQAPCRIAAASGTARNGSGDRVLLSGREAGLPQAASAS